MTAKELESEPGNMKGLILRSMSLYTAADEPFYDPTGQCGLIIDCRNFQDVSYRDRVEWKQAGLPLGG